MKPNTYVKIVSAGIANPVEELMPFIQGEELIPLGEDETVEIRSSVFNEGNIIIFRSRKSREVLSVIHTPHTVYIQEQNKTLSTHRPYSSFLFVAGEDGITSLESLAGNTTIALPTAFYLESSPELQDVAAYIVAVLDQLTPGIIEAAIEFDRFNLECRTNIAMEPAFGYLVEAIEEKTGYTLLPIKSGPGRRAINYFYLEPTQRALNLEIGRDELNPEGKTEELIKNLQ